MSVTTTSSERDRIARRAAEEALLDAIESTRAAARATARAASPGGRGRCIAYRCVDVALKALTVAVRFL